MDRRPSLGTSVSRIGLAASALKLLLVPAAHSTDLEVHRWWKTLTLSRPLAEWYTDTASVWTLDYPPLFAYFERALAAVAARVHPELVDPGRHGYDAPEAVLFMRLTVIATDVLLTFGVYRFVAAASSAADTLNAGKDEDGDMDPKVASAALVLFSPGLFLVDNVHFQYNGLVLALLLLSTSLLMERRVGAGALVFAIAINLKHTLLPVAVGLAAYLLVCVRQTVLAVSFRGGVIAAARVAASVTVVLAVSWLPLFFAGGCAALRACFHRLFPVSRGLLHAYWAPNAWAVYAFADKVAVSLGCSLRDTDVSSSSGHIGAFRPFACLPNVSPAATAALVLASIIPVVVSALAHGADSGGRRDPGDKTSHARLAVLLPRLVTFCSLSAFVFGWHVHEKMVLLATVPLGGIALLDRREGAAALRFAYAMLAIAGHSALHPLVTSPAETAYKLMHFAAYALFAVPRLVPASRGGGDVSLRWRRLCVLLYSAGAVLVELYAGAGGGHVWLVGDGRLEFLPLMAVSTYSACGVLVAWTQLGLVSLQN
jgi:alpha-1,3-glucosyltransferase